MEQPTENRKIEWFVNVGLPTDSYDVEELNAAYLDIVRVSMVGQRSARSHNLSNSTGIGVAE